MLNSLFVNACIMVAVISVAYQLVRINNQTFQTRPLLWKVLLGLAGGFIGTTLMKNSVAFDAGVIVDFRNFPVIICAIFGGSTPALIAAGIIALSRAHFWGYSTATLVAGIAIFGIAISSSTLCCKTKSFKKRWVWGLVLNLLVAMTSLIYLLQRNPILPKVLTYYTIGSAVMAIFLYWLITFHITAYENFVQLSMDSTKDFLTGLNNVRNFDFEFNKAISQSHRRNEPLSLLLLDIDHFKKVNDTYGHGSGDLILKQVATIMTEQCRIFDVISRNGGEEFSIILIDCSLENAYIAAERIRNAVEAHVFNIHHPQAESIHITISIGVASHLDPTIPREALIEFADQALYQAKQSGRNQTVVYQAT